MTGNYKTDPLLVILGPTASGKTALAVALAIKLKTEIISADSRQVYQSMDIGTGKDLLEYQNVPYHLIDILSPGEQYNLSAFQDDFQDAYRKISAKNRTAILCGGSGMYIQGVLQNFNHTNIPKNEELRSKLDTFTVEKLSKELENYPSSFTYSSHPTSKRQLIRAIETRLWSKQNPQDDFLDPSPNIPHLIFGLAPPAAVRREKITNRLKARLDEGLIDEVEQLLLSGISAEKLIYYGLEYKWTTLYLQNTISYNEFFSKLEIAIHQFAKRQMTYFRKMERDGLKVEWLNDDQDKNEHLAIILQKQNDFIYQNQ